MAIRLAIDELEIVVGYTIEHALSPGHVAVGPGFRGTRCHGEVAVGVSGGFPLGAGIFADPVWRVHIQPPMWNTGFFCGRGEIW